MLARAEMLTGKGTISQDIDVILKRPDDGMPRLFEDMKNIQASMRRPLAF